MDKKTASMTPEKETTIPSRPFSEKELNVAELKAQLNAVEQRIRKLEHNTQLITAERLQTNYNRQVELKKLRYEKADLLFTIHTL